MTDDGSAGQGASLPLHVPPDWRAAARRIIAGSIRRVFVVGARDAGKSAFCHALLRGAAAAGKSAALVDADLGQKMIGPPACVTAGRLEPGGRPVPTGLAFVGTTNPVQGWRALVGGLERLCEAAGAGLLVVNSGGLLAGPGLRLKAEKARAVRPDVVVAIGEGAALEALLSRVDAGIPAIRLASSPLARRKTEGERRRVRQEAFRAYFADAVERSITPGQVELDCELAGARPVAGLLVGLADRSDLDRGIGVVTSADPRDGRLACLVPPDLAGIARLRCGALLLGADWSDAPLPPG